MTKEELIEAVAALKIGHNYCEDSWYSCPKAEDGCSDKTKGEECDCGADAHNARVDAILTSLGCENSDPSRSDIQEQG
jgi:hypothetical protein